mmetsp:Transcript_23409/g.36627  ORF Transcript_23409/g.36627 Transcript_23409/m.36627 type:complete len:116 (+) Transcript_23409:72-419(+)
MFEVHAHRYAGNNEGIRQKIEAAGDGEEAFRIGEFGEAERSDWETTKEQVLAQGVEARVNQIPEVKEELLKTSNREINMVGGDLWMGVSMSTGTLRGQNMLGKALQAIRTKLQNT